MSRAPFSYKHEEWVAGFGDVLKHVVLTTVIRELQAEHEEGIMLVDCHAGDGVYDLNQHARPDSYKKGVLMVLEGYEVEPGNAPPAVQKFVELVKSSTGCTSSKDLDVYPGSPVLGQNLLRAVDEHRLMDLHVEDVQWLKPERSEFRPDTDAFAPETMEFIMPYTHGGKHPVILIDPDYKEDSDYCGAKKLLATILDQHPFATVIVTIPLLQNHKFRWSYSTGLRDVAKSDAKTGRYFCSITVGKDGFQGSAVLVCNPTAGLDDVLDDFCVHWLAHAMNMGKDEFVVEQTMKKKK
jgi:23S rRNA (adenine2030-N6)-methyltransferase